MNLAREVEMEKKNEEEEADEEEELKMALGNEEWSSFKV